MDDKTRIANIKTFLLKQRYLKGFTYQVGIIDDQPVILFDDISNEARGKLNQALNAGDLLHIQVAKKPKKQAPSK